MKSFDPDALLRTFEAIPAIVETYFSNIPAEMLDIRRTATAWTLREHLYHTCSVQRMLYARMVAMIEEDEPVITPYMPDREADRETAYESVEAALDDYKQMREKQLALLRAAKPGSFEKEAKHAEYSQYSIPILINHMIFHEYWHMYRVEELWLTRDEYLSQ